MQTHLGYSVCVSRLAEGPILAPGAAQSFPRDACAPARTRRGSVPPPVCLCASCHWLRRATGAPASIQEVTWLGLLYLINNSRNTNKV